MKHQDVDRMLDGLGLKKVHETKKVAGYTRLGESADVYVNREVKYSANTLIIHPRYKARIASLASIPGVTQALDKRFSSNLNHFPEGVSKKGKTQNFGFPFGFDNRLALEKFLDELGLL